MGIDYTPSFVNYTGQGKFRFWCQSVLPLVYDDSLSYMELLNKMVIYLNNTIQDVAAVETNVDSLLAAYNQLQKYVNDYFDNLDVQDEINVKLDGLVEDGTMSELIQPFIDAGLPGLVETNLPGVVEEQIPGVVADQLDDVVEEQIGAVVAEQIPDEVTHWLNKNVNPVGSAVIVDNTLTISGAAADAKTVGDANAKLKNALNNYHTNGDIFLFNLVKPTSWNDNCTVNTATGGLTINQPDYFATDYIPVTTGTKYKSNVGRNWAWYDANKTYISGSTGAGIQSGITAPENAAYIRFTVSKTTDGIDTPSMLYFTDVNSYSNDTNISNMIKSSLAPLETFRGGFIDFSKYAIYENNLIDPVNYNDNCVINVETGGLSINQPNFFATDYIPVTAGREYKSNVGRNWAWYDENKTYISGTGNPYIQLGITAPENAAYIRFTVNKTTDGINTPWLLYFADSSLYNTERVFGLDFTAKILQLYNNMYNAVQFNDNKINPYNYNDNCTINTTNGNLSLNHPTYFATDYIPVTAGTEYKANVGRNLAWYDSNKEFISGSNGTGIQSGVTAPENAAYIRFTVSKTTDGIDNPWLLYFTESENYRITNAEVWCYGKKINWIGDSIVDGPDFDEQVCSALGLVKDSEYGINGSTIALKADGTDTRHALCIRYADMTDDADIIAVSCGTNDFEYAWCPIGSIDSTENTTFYGALKTLCEGLINKYPQKLIFFTTPIKRAQPFENGDGGEYTADGVMTTPFSKNKYGKTLGDYADIIKEVCGYYSIPVLDMYRESLLNPHLASQQNLFDSAYTHPNTTGQKIMARRVAGWLTQLGYTISGLS